MNIIVDIDGILRDITGKVLNIYKRDFDPKSTVKVEDITKYSFEDIPALKAFGDVRHTLFGRYGKELFLESDPYPEAVKTLRELAGNHFIHLATVQLPENRDFTLQWLEKHGIPFNLISFCESGRDKCWIHGHVLIDDCTANLQSYQKFGCNTKADLITIDKPWNKDWPGMRIASIANLPKTLKTLEV